MFFSLRVGASANVSQVDYSLVQVDMAYHLNAGPSSTTGMHLFSYGDTRTLFGMHSVRFYGIHFYRHPWALTEHHGWHIRASYVDCDRDEKFYYSDLGIGQLDVKAGGSCVVFSSSLDIDLLEDHGGFHAILSKGRIGQAFVYQVANVNDAGLVEGNSDGIANEDGTIVYDGEVPFTGTEVGEGIFALDGCDIEMDELHTDKGAQVGVRNSNLKIGKVMHRGLMVIEDSACEFVQYQDTETAELHTDHVVINGHDFLSEGKVSAKNTVFNIDGRFQHIPKNWTCENVAIQMVDVQTKDGAPVYLIFPGAKNKNAIYYNMISMKLCSFSILVLNKLTS